MRSIDNSKKSSLDDNSKGNSPFMKFLGKPLGYMTIDEQHRVMNISWMPLRHSPHDNENILSMVLGAQFA